MQGKTARQLGLLLLVVVGIYGLDAPTARSQGGEDERLMREAGLVALKGCEIFESREALLRRRDAWRAYLDALAAKDRPRLWGWIIGRKRPPRAVVDEASAQRDCMLLAMYREASRENSGLEMALPGKKEADAATIARAIKRAEKSPASQRALLKPVVESDYRGAGAQAWIWHRKYVFSGRAFNRVTPAAARACGLPVGSLWRPWEKSHTRCWRSKLSALQREKEILEASSGPGLSRHHWGTDFDLFALAPTRFGEEGDLVDEYLWLSAQGLQFGFFQTYRGTPSGEVGYMEERWHWSYFPIAGALLDFAREHPEQLEAALKDQWDGIEAAWRREDKNSQEHFLYLRENWRGYVFGVAKIDLERLPSERPPPKSPTIEAAETKTAPPLRTGQSSATTPAMQTRRKQSGGCQP